MANSQPAQDAPQFMIPPPRELLARFTHAEPNDPERSGGTVSDLFDELGEVESVKMV